MHGVFPPLQLRQRTVLSDTAWHTHKPHYAHYAETPTSVPAQEPKTATSARCVCVCAQASTKNIDVDTGVLVPEITHKSFSADRRAGADSDRFPQVVGTSRQTDRQTDMAPYTHSFPTHMYLLPLDRLSMLWLVLAPFGWKEAHNFKLLVCLLPCLCCPCVVRVLLQ